MTGHSSPALSAKAADYQAVKPQSEAYGKYADAQDAGADQPLSSRRAVE